MDCKGGTGEKAAKNVSRVGYIMPKTKKVMQSQNFFSAKTDIFNVDRG